MKKISKEENLRLFTEWAIKQLKEAIEMGANDIDLEKSFTLELKVKQSAKKGTTLVTQGFSNNSR